MKFKIHQFNKANFAALMQDFFKHSNPGAIDFHGIDTEKDFIIAEIQEDAAYKLTDEQKGQLRNFISPN